MNPKTQAGRKLLRLSSRRRVNPLLAFLTASLVAASFVSAFTAEVESLPVESGSYVDTYSNGSASGPTNGYHRVRGSDNGDFVEYTVNVPQAGNYTLAGGFATHNKCGRWQLSIDGATQSTPLELYAPTIQWVEFTLGTKNLTAGNHTFRFEVVGVNPANRSGSRQGRFDYIRLDTGAQAALSSKQKAQRFLKQATFGPTLSEINTLASEISSMGETPALEAWINEQFAKAPSLHEDLLREMVNYENSLEPGIASKNVVFTRRGSAWWTRSLLAEDQLRQRVAWALSQILVVGIGSDAFILRNPYGLSNYYDTLVKNSFGNYRTALYDVARHPVMGRYLGHAGNKKIDPVAGTFPDENFAREVLQLFSIGLVELNLDSSVKQDSQGKELETYTNQTIMEFAKVFTGLNYDNGRNKNPLNLDMSSPMVAFEDEHDKTPKQLLKGFTTVANRSTLQDLDSGITNIFNHPNVAPFISKLLIQRLVTSNPSYSYIENVAQVFEDNGSNVRGDMKAVIKAILLHPEARNEGMLSDPEHGKFEETLLSMSGFLRAFNLSTAHPKGWFTAKEWYDSARGISPFYSPSVFNFYPVDYQPSGPITDAGLVGPEFGVLNESRAVGFMNLFRDATGGSNAQYIFNTAPDPNNFSFLNFDRERAFLLDSSESKTKNDEDLVAHLESLLLADGLKANTRSIILTAMANRSSVEERMQTAIYLILISPEYHTLR